MVLSTFYNFLSLGNCIKFEKITIKFLILVVIEFIPPNAHNPLPPPYKLKILFCEPFLPSRRRFNHLEEIVKFCIFYGAEFMLKVITPLNLW